MGIAEDRQLVAQLTEAMQRRFFNTNDRLIRSLIVQARMNEAEKWLIRTKVMMLTTGDYTPSMSAIQAALIVSQREITQWLEDQYGEHWDEIGRD